MPAYDVAICGAGVGGLTLARALGRQGRRVLLVDRHRRHRGLYKGELLQPRSLQIFDALDALPALLRRGALPASRLVCRAATGAELGALDYSLLAAPFDHCLVHYYGDIKEALADGLPESVETRRGVTVEGPLFDSAGRISGLRLNADGRRSEARATVTIACDGHASRLRSAAGIDARPQRYPHQLIAFDLDRAAGLDPDVSAYLTRRGLRIVFPMPGARARLYVQVPAGEFRRIGRGGLAGWADGVLDSAPGLRVVAAPLRAGLASVQVMSAWRFVADSWTRPGLGLLGDAAHCVHPMAAQGMNAAIADAWTLGQQLAGPGPLGPDVADDALRRYEAVRRPQLEYVSRLSHNLATLFTATSWHVRLIGDHVLRSNKYNRRLQHFLTLNMSGLGVHRFGFLDRLHQFGLPDPRARRIPVVPNALVSTSAQSPGLMWERTPDPGAETDLC